MVAEASDYSIYRRVVSQLMQGQEQLPSLPTLTLDIRRALSDGQVGVAALARLIGRDPALAALLMEHASSALYRHPVAPRTLQDVIVLLGVLVALNLLGATSLIGAVLGSAGVVGLVLGFAFKDIAENYIAGILLSIRRPFNPGDMVRIDSHEGRVVALTSRATQLMTPDGNHLLLPNALVFKSVMLNYTRNPNRRVEFTTNVATGRSWNKAMDIGIQTLRGIDGVLADPAPTALIQDLANDAALLSALLDKRADAAMEAGRAAVAATAPQVER